MNAWRQAGWPVVVGVAVRLAVLAAVWDMRLYGDELIFYHGAQELLAGVDVSFFPFRPPLYIGFCALVGAVLGPAAHAIRIVQILLEGLTILGVFELGRRTVGARVGLLGAWIFALYPEAIAYSHSLWNESLSLLLLTWGLVGFVALVERPRARGAILTGLVWGALCLAKPQHLYLLPFILAAAAWSRTRGERKAALAPLAIVLVTVLAVVTPWSVYVSVDEGEPILICTTGRKNLRVGVNYAPPPQFDYATAWTMTSEERKQTPKRKVGVAAFILEEPGLFVRRSVEKMSYLWSPNSFLVRHLYEPFLDEGGRRRWKYARPQSIPASVRVGIVTLSMLATAALCIGLLVGSFTGRGRALVALTAAYVLPYMAMITLTPALSRYRLVMMVFAVLHTAAVLTDGPRVLERLRRPGPALGVALGLAGLAALWWLRVPDVVSAIW